MRSAATLVLLTALCAGALPAARADASFENLTAEQGRTLLALARDFDAEGEERPGPAYAACVARYDAEAADPADRVQMEESFQLIVGAVRRMGYQQYADISDDYERLRLAKILGERGWLKRFRTEVIVCLAARQPAAR
jgi:hypothetical protein